MREEEVERVKDLEAWDDHIERVHGGIQTLSGEVLQNARAGRRRRRVQKVQASIEIETDSDIEEDDSSCRKRRRISEGGLRDISEAPTLVEVSINTSSLERTTDGNLEITSRIDPRLL
jgi:hypothetical protein